MGNTTPYGTITYEGFVSRMSPIFTPMNSRLLESISESLRRAAEQQMTEAIFRTTETPPGGLMNLSQGPLHISDRLEAVEAPRESTSDSEPKQLLGNVDLALRWGESRQVISNWKDRHDDFPRVYTRINNGSTPVYLLDDVRKYEKARGLDMRHKPAK